MTRDDGRTAPLRDTAPARLAELGDLLGGESAASRRFLGGLIAGALVGAALAGTALLRQRQPRPGAKDARS